MCKEKVYLVVCDNCSNQKQMIIKGRVVYGTKRTCYYCKKKFKLNKNNILTL